MQRGSWYCTHSAHTCEEGSAQRDVEPHRRTKRQSELLALGAHTSSALLGVCTKKTFQCLKSL